MYDELVPAIEDYMIATSGAIPVVFEGLSHTLEKTAPDVKVSSHTSHELLYVRNGKLDVMIEGHNIVIEKGSTLIIRPNSAHSVRVTSGTADIFVLYFGFSRDAGAVNTMLGMVREVKPKKAPGPSIVIPPSMDQTSVESFLDFASGSDRDELQKAPYLTISGGYKKSISNIVERIVEENKDNLYSKEVMMQILTLELMLTLARAMKKEWEESLRVRNGKARELVLIARDYIDQNYERGITIADAASYVFLSQGYFTRAFRDEFGISPMGYLMKKRLDRACELLGNDGIKVSGVASQSGFSSPQRFNAAFRKQMGMTPMEYRKQILRK